MAGKATAVAKADEHTDMVISTETRTMFASMVTAIPDVDTDGASERIVLQILQAETWDDVDAPWDREPKDELIDKEMRIDSIMRRQSSYAGGLGVFLIVRGHLIDDERDVVFTTSSISVVAQLVKLFMLNALPVYAKLLKSERPSANGYWPQHLEVFGSAGETGRQ